MGLTKASSAFLLTLALLATLSGCTAREYSFTKMPDLQFASQGKISLSFEYEHNPATYYVGQAIHPNHPIVRGELVSRYEFIPQPDAGVTALPDGIKLNPATGVITGTPTTATLRTDYLIRAHGETKHSDLTLSIGVFNERLPAHEEFTNLASKGKKKIDFLFVVDNSGSMGDKQANLAAGFQKFAQTYFNRKDLNICTHIITSDRYCGRNGEYCGARDTSNRERSVRCTNEDDWDSLTDADRTIRVNEIINDFVREVKVGVEGASPEMLGKSLVTSLYDLNRWGEAINSTRLNPFFRKEAVANITFLTDENNFYVDGPAMDEASNDIPATVNQSVPGSSPAKTDGRQGILQYLDQFFAQLTGKTANPTYSVTTALYQDNPSWIFAKAANLALLDTLVGRDSIEGNILASADGFTSLYDKVGENLVRRFSTFQLQHEVDDPALPNATSDFQVTLVRRVAGVVTSRTKLVYNVDFALRSGNQIEIISTTLADSFKEGDSLEVDYYYPQ